ncbi:peptidylprolyl isomerase [Kosmotoga pacifica]|uniref:peptidylprolyl isomerase n=1 Tax=Kosmotoga pacifica TaxID=1330330 RepID=UPI00069C95BE|nr:peptidylprolyl isomerase [Kosmotoga pacifica]
MKRFVFLALFLFAFAFAFAVDGEEIASITLNGTQLADTYYHVYSDELQAYLNDALGNYQQQGQFLDPYFSSQSVPSQIELKYNILMNLLDDKMAGYFAKENGLFPNETEVTGYTDQITAGYFADEQAIAQIETSYGSTETFWRVIESYVRSELIKQNILQTLVTDYPASFTEYFEQNKDEIKNKYEKVSASHILLSSEASATEIKKLIESGVLSFEDAAKKYSLDPGSAQNGGYIGEFNRGQLVKEFEDAAFSGNPGEIIGPVRTEYGFHLIRVEAKSTFDSVTELLSTQAYINVARDFQNKVYSIWFSDYKLKSPLGYVIHDPELALLDRLMKSQKSGEDIDVFYDNLEKEIFDAMGNIKKDTTGFAAGLYLMISDSLMQPTLNNIQMLQAMLDTRENLPEEMKAFRREDMENYLEETADSTDDRILELRNALQSLINYSDELGVFKDEEIKAKLEEEEAYRDKRYAVIGKVAEYFYNIMPNSDNALEYLNKYSGNNPEVVFLYTNKLYKDQIEPLLENEEVFQNYLDYYKQYVGEKAGEILIKYPLLSIENRLKENVIESNSAPAELKLKAVRLLIEAFSKAGKLPLDKGLKIDFFSSALAYSYYLEDYVDLGLVENNEIEDLTDGLMKEIKALEDE